MDEERTSLGVDELDDDAPLDPAASAALIAEQRARTGAALGVDGRVLFGAWGVAWVLGYGALWLAASDLLGVDDVAAGALFAGLLVAAVVVTSVHLARRSAGVRGASATRGAMYGWAWALGFAGVFSLGSALARAGASAEVVATAMNLVSPLVVGILYMAGAAIWQERPQFALGAGITLVTLVASALGMPHLLLVMALGGGGGMLALALAWHLRRPGRVARR